MTIQVTQTFTVAASAAGSTHSWVPLDIHQDPFKVSFGVKKGNMGGVTVQHTYDNLYDANVSASPFDHDTAVKTVNGSAGAAAVLGSYDYPISGIRIQAASVSVSSCKYEFWVLQSG